MDRFSKMFYTGDDIDELQRYRADPSQPLTVAEMAKTPVEVLFWRLPDPRADPYPAFIDEQLCHDFGILLPGNKEFMFVSRRPALEKYYQALQGCEAAARRINSADAALPYLRTLVAGDIWKRILPFINNLAYLAVKQPDQLDHANDKIKSTHMAYYRWLALGRKDEENPFTENSVTPGKGVAHDFLPNNVVCKKCAGCGQNDAMHLCSGCLVSKNGRAIFKTAYCSQKCQAAHWKKHRTYCRELRQIDRAAGMYKELLDRFLETAYFTRVNSISERDGLVEAKYNSVEGPDNIFLMRNLPMELAPSPEVAKAVLMASQSHIVANTCKELFEIFLSGTYMFKWRVGIGPKNAHFSVLHTHPKEDSLKEFTTLWKHDIIRLITSSGLDIAFDPTGEKFGWAELISPWSSYRDHRIRRAYCQEGVNEDCAEENLRSYLIENGHIPRKDICGVLYDDARLVKSMVSDLNAEIARLTAGQGISDILARKPQAFEKARASIMAAGRKCLDAQAAIMERTIKPYARSAGRARSDWLGQARTEQLYCPEDLQRLFRGP